MLGATRRVFETSAPLAVALGLASSVVGCGSDEPLLDGDAPAERDAPTRPDGSAPGDDAGCAPACDDAGSPPAPAPDLPRNVILLLGDGMGPRHLEAARAYAGTELAVDALLGPVLYRTESVDGAITDSAASATAMATGRCTLNGVLSLDPEGSPLETLLELSQRDGKQVGLITNSYVLDASPMAFATHVPDRGLGAEIARQLVLESHPEVVMGGWLPPEALAPEAPLESLAGGAGYTVGRTLTDLEGAPPAAPLFGLFGEGPSSVDWPPWEWGLTPEALRPPDSDEPTLSQMASLALGRLENAPGGFFLFVESELADTIGHGSAGDPTLAAAILPPAVLELDAAVRVVLDWVSTRSSFDDTLVVVASDHETGRYVASSSDPLAGTFGTTDHTDLPVPVYARGPGADALDRVRHVSDLHGLITRTLSADGERTGRCP